MKSSIAIVRGEEKEHAMLTAEIATAAFGVTPDEHKDWRGNEGTYNDDLTAVRIGNGIHPGDDILVSNRHQ